MAFVGTVLGDLFSDAQIGIYLDLVAPGPFPKSKAEGIGIVPAAGDRVADGVAISEDDGIRAFLSPLFSRQGRDRFARSETAASDLKLTGDVQTGTRTTRSLRWGYRWCDRW